MAKLCYMYTHCQSVWNCDGVNAYYKIVVLIIFLRCTCREHTQAYMYYFLILHAFQYCCSALRDAFVRQIKEGYSHADKQLRYVRHLWCFLFWSSKVQFTQYVTSWCHHTQIFLLYGKIWVWDYTYTLTLNRWSFSSWQIKMYWIYFYV